MRKGGHSRKRERKNPYFTIEKNQIKGFYSGEVKLGLKPVLMPNPKPLHWVPGWFQAKHQSEVYLQSGSV